MAFTDLLRITVLLLAAAATALGAVTVIVSDPADDAATLIVAAAWWLIAIGVGFFLGGPKRASDSLTSVLAAARTTALLPAPSPGRVALGRVWPLVTNPISSWSWLPTLSCFTRR